MASMGLERIPLGAARPWSLSALGLLRSDDVVENAHVFVRVDRTRAGGLVKSAANNYFSFEMI